MWKELLQRIAVIALGIVVVHVCLIVIAAILGAALGLAAPFASASPKTPNIFEAGATGITVLMLLYVLIGAGDLGIGILLSSIVIGVVVFFASR